MSRLRAAATYLLALLLASSCSQGPKEYQHQWQHVPWPALSDCDIGILLCRLGTNIGTDMETMLECRALTHSVLALFGHQAEERYGADDMHEIFLAAKSSGGLGKSDTRESLCTTATERIQSRIPRSKLESAYRLTQSVRCLDTCFEYQVPTMADCSPSVLTDRALWRARKCSIRIGESQSQVEPAFQYCRTQCMLDEVSPSDPTTLAPTSTITNINSTTPGSMDTPPSLGFKPGADVPSPLSSTQAALPPANPTRSGPEPINETDYDIDADGVPIEHETQRTYQLEPESSEHDTPNTPSSIEQASEARGQSGPSPEPRNRSLAERLNRQGLSLRRHAGDHERALRHYLKAVEADPTHEWSRYNAACELALLGNTDEAMKHLDALSALRTGEAKRALRAAITDDDMATLRNTAEFRRLVSANQDL